MDTHFIQYLIEQGFLNAETFHQEHLRWKTRKKTNALVLKPIDSVEEENEDIPTLIHTEEDTLSIESLGKTLFETGWLSQSSSNDTLHQELEAFENRFQRQSTTEDLTKFTPPSFNQEDLSQKNDITKFTPPPFPDPLPSRQEDTKKCILSPDQDLLTSASNMAQSASLNFIEDSKEGQNLADISSENRYEDLKLLGEGGMGIVQSARDRILQRNVALKTIRSKKTLQGKSTDTELWMTWRLKTEAYITAYLEHPNIVPLYDLQQKKDAELFFTMRKIGGKTLDVLIKEKRALLDRKKTLKNEEEKKYLDVILKKYDENKFLSIFFKVCDAVAYAHSKGVIHRDLKPENIMVGEFGEVYVMDWGIAKKQRKKEKGELEEEIEESFPKRDTSKQMLSKMLWEETFPKTALENNSPLQWKTIGGMGTIGYMPPEQQEDATQVTPQSDVYALGKILRQIYILYSPLEEYKNQIEFDKTQMEKTGEKQPDYPQKSTLFPQEIFLEKNLPRDIVAIIEKSTQENPKLRYESVKEFSDDLERYLNDTHVSVREYTFQEVFGRWIRHHRFQIIFGVVLFVMGCIGIGYFNLLLGQRFDLKGEQVFKLAQEEMAKVRQLEINVPNAKQSKLEILLNTINTLDSALLLSSQKEKILQEKAKVGDQLIRLCCETEDYLLADYFAKELYKQNSITPHHFRRYKEEIQQAKNHQLDSHKARLSYWQRQFQEREITSWEQEEVILEISKMQEDEIFQQLLQWLEESTNYFKDEFSKNSRKTQWYKTIIIALGRLERSQAGEPILKALEQLLNATQTHSNEQENAEKKNILIKLAKSLGNAKPLHLSLSFQKLREQIGKYNLFWYETQYVFDALLQIDLAYQETLPEEESVFERGKFLYYLNKYKEAKSVLKQAIQKYPKRSEILFYLSQISIHQKEYPEAIALLTQSLQIHPENVHYYLARSETAFLQGQYEPALQDVQKALQLATNESEPHLFHGKLLKQKQEWEKALSAYQKAIALKPEDGEAYYHQGKVYEQLKEWNEAQKSYTEAILHFPYYQEAYLARGQIFYERKQMDAALRDLTQALQIRFSEEGYQIRGKIFLETQQYKEAKLDYEKLLEVVPTNLEGQLQLSYIYFKQNEHETALQELDRILQKHPKTAQAYYYQSLIYLDLKNWESTLKSVQEGLEIDPESSELYLSQGKAYQGLNDIKKSIASYTQAIKCQGKKEEAYFLRGQVYITEKNWQRAIQDFSEVLRINPQHSQTYYQQAQVYFLQEKRSEAFQSLHEAIRLDPTFIPAIQFRIQLKQESLDLIGVLQDLELILNQTPQDSEIYHQRALIYWKQEKWEEALQDLNKAIQLSPQFSKAYFQRGLLHIQTKNENSAITDFNSTILFQPDFAEAYYQRGRLWQKQKNWNKALTDYQKAIEFNPTQAEFYLARGDLYSQTYPKISLADYQKAIELSPQSKDAYFRRANLYFQQQQFEEALNDYSAILIQDANDVIAHYSKGQIYTFLHQEKEALESYQTAIQLHPEDFRSFYSRGVLYLALKKETEAIKDFSEGLKQNFRYAPFYAELGYAFQQQGNNENAFKNYQISLQINPRYAPTYLYFGQYQEKQKNYESAQKNYQQAILLDASYAPAYLSLGWLQYNYFSKKEGLENFEKSILYFKNLNIIPIQAISLYTPLVQKLFTQHRDLFEKCKRSLELQISETAPPSCLLGLFLWQETKFYVEQKDKANAKKNIEMFFKYFPKFHPSGSEMNIFMQRINPSKKR